MNQMTFDDFADAVLRMAETWNGKEPGLPQLIFLAPDGAFVVAALLVPSRVIREVLTEQLVVHHAVHCALVGAATARLSKGRSRDVLSITAVNGQELSVRTWTAPYGPDHTFKTFDEGPVVLGGRVVEAMRAGLFEARRRRRAVS